MKKILLALVITLMMTGNGFTEPTVSSIGQPVPLTFFQVREFMESNDEFAYITASQYIHGIWEGFEVLRVAIGIYHKTEHGHLLYCKPKAKDITASRIYQITKKFVEDVLPHQEDMIFSALMIKALEREYPCYEGFDPHKSEEE